MACVITLTGASGCGKSTIIKILQEIGSSEKYCSQFKPVVIKKYTTRAFRKSELEAIREGKINELDIKAVYGDNNVICDEQGKMLSPEKQDEQRKRLLKKLKCDLVYEQYGNQYGIRFAELYDCLKRGESPIVILNDVRTVEDIRVYLGKKCVSMFIFRSAPNIDDYERMGEERHTSRIEVENRYKKATAIYRIYIENIHLFDKLILNVKDGTESLQAILEQLVEQICQKGPMFVNEKR